MLLKNSGKPVIMLRLYQVGHFVNNNVLKQILGLFHKFRIKPDVPGLMVAASSLGFHPPEKIGHNLYIQFFFPLLYDRGDDLVKQ